MKENVCKESKTEIHSSTLAKHAAKCKICGHPRRHEIEADFIDWESGAQIARRYKLGERSGVYRHANALRLGRKRDRNLRNVLARLIERGDEAEVTGATVVAAVQAYAKINSFGEWDEGEERELLRDVFERMSAEELGEYAQSGTLPDWAREEFAAAGVQIDGESEVEE